ncbi:uncharacterized protein YkwD [Sphingomonas jejuensis]|uniref:Uncharacterized protein YkwD n=1 Tax=Sphingomonas jejuensis TaxID=904715 RepID=A0ABX0XJ96_9SPHN|nr:CAP domain-containing protein [Sphingomonas jejuensis]NJC33401.1 uncharacterized protein YkwD [Sphingomonas jejuensis]
MRTAPSPPLALVLPAIALLTACGGGGGGDTQAAPVTIVPPAATTPAPAPAATTPTPAPAPAATAPAATGWAGAAAALYDSAPDLASCRAGALKAGVRQQALAELNALRARHGLAAVAYAPSGDGEVAEASMMMAANGQLSHTPPTSWTCYTAAGANGAGSGNLYMAWGNGLGFMSADDHFAAWINEGGSNALGHRRWLLDPFLGQVSYGRFAVQRADGHRIDAVTLKVFGFAAAAAAPGTVPGFVAVPQGDYPVRYFRAGDYLSFSVAPSRNRDGSDRRVGLSGARVTVTDPAGATLPIADQSADNNGYGLANNLQWRVAGLVRGTEYRVRIDGVTGAPAASYSYAFRVVD